MSFIEVFHTNTMGINIRKTTYGEEYEMVQEFISYKKNNFCKTKENQLAIFSEPKINNAYPDIVFVEYDPQKFIKWNDARNNLNINNLKILSYIIDKSKVTSLEMIKDFAVSYKDLLITLEKLYDSELIDRVNGNWIMKTDASFGVKKVEAIEAKINQWQVVTQQALLNTNFASESYVLSKRAKIPKKQIIDNLSKFGIGLYLLNGYKFLKVSQSTKNKFPVNYNSICFNEWIGRIINS